MSHFAVFLLVVAFVCLQLSFFEFAFVHCCFRVCVCWFLLLYLLVFVFGFCCLFLLLSLLVFAVCLLLRLFVCLLFGFFFAFVLLASVCVGFCFLFACVPFLALVFDFCLFFCCLLLLMLFLLCHLFVSACCFAFVLCLFCFAVGCAWSSHHVPHYSQNCPHV